MSHPFTIQLLRTEPHNCSYLPELIATTEFVSPEQKVDLSLYQALNDANFRRSGQHFYRPNCEKCDSCKPLRINTNDFTPSKSHKRVQKKNAHLRIKLKTQPDPDLYFLLYERYILERHQGGDMYPPSREQFDNFICAGADSSHFIEFWDHSDDAANPKENLIMVAVCDFLPLGLSAIYSFFEPTKSHLSLGTQAILTQIEISKKMKLSYLYLGYWIKESSKMNYKSRFQPSEILENGEWQPLPF